MDLQFRRIISVLIGTILINCDHVTSQGTGGIAIGLGMGGDLMLDTPMGDIPTPLLAMGGDTGMGAANQQLNTGGGGMMGDPHAGTGGGPGVGLDSAFLMNLFGTSSAPILFPGTFSTGPLMSSSRPLVLVPGSLGISDQQNAAVAIAASQASTGQTDKQPNYVMQNEGFTALGNVGHLVRVPVSPTASLSSPTVVLNQLATVGGVSTGNQLGSNMAGTVVQIQSPSATILGNSVANGNTVSISGEPVAMFNPGSGMASEMAALQSSLAGDKVDMSGFAPPPFTSSVTSNKPAKTEGRRMNTVSGNTQKVSLSLTGISPVKTSNFGTFGALDNNIMSSNKIGTASISFTGSSSNFNTNSMSNTIDHTNEVPHVEDLVTSGIYPFEGSPVARDATVDRKMKIVSDLEQAIKASGHEPLHLESPSSKPFETSVASSSLKFDQAYGTSSSGATAEVNKVSLTLSDASSSSPSSSSSAMNGAQLGLGQLRIGPNGGNINSFDNNVQVQPKISLRLSDIPMNELDQFSQKGDGYDTFSNKIAKKTATLSFGAPLPTSKTAKITLNPQPAPAGNKKLPIGRFESFDTVDVQQPVAPLEPSPVDTVHMGSNNKAILANDASSFLSPTPKEIKVNDPNYITVLRNVVGVVESKDMPPPALSTSGGNKDLRLTPIVNVRGGSAVSTRDVFTGSNGAPITNMAGIGVHNHATNNAQQPSFSLNAPAKTTLNSGKLSSGFAFEARQPESNTPSSSFIIGAGKPNARIVKSNARPETGFLSDVPANSGMSIDNQQINSMTNTNNQQNSFRDIIGQQPQNLASDSSAWPGRSIDTPTVNSVSLNLQASNRQGSSNRGSDNTLNTKATGDVRVKQPERFISKGQRQRVFKETKTSAFDIPTPHSTKAQVVDQTLHTAIQDNASKQSRFQEVVNVEPGWANSVFSVASSTSNNNQVSNSPLKPIRTNIVNVDNKLQDQNLGLMVDTPYAIRDMPTSRFDIQSVQVEQAKTNPEFTLKIRNPSTSPVVQKSKATSNAFFDVGQFTSSAGSNLAKNNPRPARTITSTTAAQQARASTAPSVDFMTSFLNNQNTQTRPTFNSGAKSVSNTDSKRVDQFGVADIYTREPRLTPSQWQNLLSSVKRPSSNTQSNQNNIQYETFNVDSQSRQPTAANPRINQFSRRPGVLRHVGGASSSIRTMFKAPGVTNGGTNVHPNLKSGFRKQINNVFTVPLRNEFVATNSVSKSATGNNAGSPTESIMMPMFPHEGVQRNQVAGPNSGSTRAFDASIIDQGAHQLGGSQQASGSAFDPQGSTGTFNIGNAVVIGDPSSQTSMGGRPISVNSANINQFASTGSRLGQPMVTSNSQQLSSSTSQLLNRQQGSGSQFAVDSRALQGSGSQFGSNTRSVQDSGSQFGSSSIGVQGSGSQFGSDNRALQGSGSQFGSSSRGVQDSGSQFGSSSRGVQGSGSQFGSSNRALQDSGSQFTSGNRALQGSGSQFSLDNRGIQDSGSQFTSGNRQVIFGTAGTSQGRALGVKSTGGTSSSSQGLGSAASPPLVACKYTPDPTSRNHFIFEFRGFRHRFRCALGTAFDAATCECSTLVSGSGDCLEVHMDFNGGRVEDSSVNRLPIGVENVEVTNQSTPLTGIALFGENSKLTIWRYQNYDFRDHIMLKVQFRPGQGGGRFQPLISNCDALGGAPSVAIVYDSQLQEVLLVLKTDNDTNKELSFPINPNEWNDVTYIYDGQEFIGIVNGVRRYVSRQDPHLLGIIGGEIKSLPTQGLIEIRDAALVLGYCPRWGHYNGAMVDIQVYACIPRDFRLE